MAPMTALLASLAACGGDGDDTADAAPPSYEGIALRTDGWLRGDLHMHTTHSDGWEDVATVIGLAEYLEDEQFVAFHPEYEGNGLDFIAITDHDSVDAWSDPGFASDRLVLVHSEEFGCSGHANPLGISERIPCDSDGDGVTIEDWQAAVDNAHAQGAVLSPNHPLLPGIPWPWDVRDHDAMEVWNSGWGLMAPENTEENLLAWEASHGAASPMYWRAIQTQGQGASMQALTWYEALLARGVHVALVGGSDRHAVLLPGFPTTWVRGETVDEAGLVQGIRDRHTFVARTPASAQVLLRVEVGGEVHEMGDQVAVPEAGADVTVRVRVGRAEGGVVGVKAGSQVETDEELEEAPLGSVVLEETVEDADFEAEVPLFVHPGDWVYPFVVEPLVLSDTEAEQADFVRELATAVAETDEEDFGGLAVLVTQVVDGEVLADGSRCDPSAWDPQMLQCLPVDDEGFGSFYVPDAFDRALNVMTEESAVTDWCMGAVGSAVLFVAE